MTLLYRRVFGFFFFSSRRRHTRCSRDWSSDVCSSDLRRSSTSSPIGSWGFAPVRAPSKLRIGGVRIGVESWLRERGTAMVSCRRGSRRGGAAPPGGETPGRPPAARGVPGGGGQGREAPSEKGRGARR